VDLIFRFNRTRASHNDHFLAPDRDFPDVNRLRGSSRHQLKRGTYINHVGNERVGLYAFCNTDGQMSWNPNRINEQLLASLN
jgi:hypothetical protein